MALGKQLKMQRRAIDNHSVISGLMDKLCLITAICHLAFLLAANAQGFEAAYDPNFPPNTYRSEQNPYYWRNQPPPGDYWQQDVQYKLEASFDETASILEGQLDLTYWNNSPNQINEVHLLLGDLLMNDGKGYIEIQQVLHKRTGKILSQIEAASGEKRQVFALGQILQSGYHVSLQIDFITHFDKSEAESSLEILKNGEDGIAVKGGNWFPRVANYNTEGWDPSISAGPFGTFNVKLDFPGNYVLLSSARLQNRNRVYGEYLEDILSIDDTLNRVTNFLAQEMKNRKVWKYHHENSNDFAFVASPSIRRLSRDKGLVQMDFWGWKDTNIEQDVLSGLSKRLQANNEKFGRYPHSNLDLFFLQGSRAFPMINFISGNDQSLDFLSQALLDAQWFGAIIGAKDQKMQDLLTAIVQYLSLTEEKNRNLMRELVYDGFREARKGEDQVESYWTEIDKYTLGLFYMEDELGQFHVLKQLAKFAKDWRFRHVETNDFWQYFYEIRTEKLNQYIGQFDEENLKIDFAIDSSSLKKVGDGIYHLKINRKGNLHVPIELAVKDLTGKVTKFYIPAVEKRNTRLEGKKLRMWTMEDGDTYEEEIKIPYGLKSIKFRGRLAYVDCFAEDNTLPKKRPEEKKKKKGRKKHLGKKKDKNNKKK